MEISSGTSVKIMAVRSPMFWMFAAVLAVASTGCGSTPAPETSPVPAPKAASVKPEPGHLIDSRPSVVAFGNSLSAGFGLDPGQSFPDEVQKSLVHDGFPYQVINMGVSGDTTTDGVERLPEILALKPSAVVLEFGGNDGLRGLPVDSTKANLAKMIAALQKTGAKVILAGMTLPRNYGNDYIRSFESVYVELAKQYKTPLIPFLLDGVGGHPNLMQADGIHPTAEGARIVAKTVVHYLEPELSKNPRS